MKRKLRAAIGIILSLLLLGWALRDVSPDEVLLRFRSANLLYLSLAIGIALSSFWIRALRWGLLLLPVVGRVPFRPRLAATFIGFMVNNLLPARIGEFARAFSLARLSGIPVASAFATLVIERLLDGIVLVVLLFAVMASPTFPAIGALGGIDIRSAALVVAVAMSAIGLGLGLVVAAPRLAATLAYRATGVLPGRLRAPTLAALRAFATGLAVLRTPRLFFVSAALALFQWTFVALSFFYGFRAFGIDHVPFSGAVFLQSLLSLAVAIPSSPGFFGPFEAAVRVGLGFWQVPVEQSISFAIGFHLGGFIPVTLIGIYYVWRLNLSWSKVSRSDEAFEQEVRMSEPSPPTRTDTETRR